MNPYGQKRYENLNDAIKGAVNSFRITQYFPTFIDGPVPEISHFNNLKELLEIDWIERWSNGQGFEKFIMTEDNMLMAKLTDGQKFMVGRITILCLVPLILRDEF